MLKSNSLEDVDRVIDRELFSELTPEEGAAIAGGLKLRNDTNVLLNVYTFDKFFNVSLQSIPAGPGGEKDIALAGDKVYLLYDKKKGFGLEPHLEKVENNGIYTFVAEGDELIVRLGFQTYTTVLPNGDISSGN